MGQVFSGSRMINRLVEQGVIPDGKIKRVVIDVPWDRPVRIYVESFLDSDVVEIPVELLRAEIWGGPGAPPTE